MTVYTSYQRPKKLFVPGNLGNGCADFYRTHLLIDIKTKVARNLYFRKRKRFFFQIGTRGQSLGKQTCM